MDTQEIAALAIVSVAAIAVGKRLWKQVRGFSAKSGGGGCASGCDGCNSAATPDKPRETAPLVHIQLNAPRRITRPTIKP